MADAAVANKAAVALAAVGTSTASTTHANLTGRAVAVAGAFWGKRRFANTAVADFSIAAL